MKKKVGVLVSGGGTNLQALIDFEAKNADCPYEIVLVLSDHKDAYALERAKNAGIESRIVSPYAVLGADVAKASDRDTKRLAVSNKILEYCKEFGVEIIVEAGCLTVLAGDVLNVYANKIINLHPALLPKFGSGNMFGYIVFGAYLRPRCVVFGGQHDDDTAIGHGLLKCLQSTHQHGYASKFEKLLWGLRAHSLACAPCHYYSPLFCHTPKVSKKNFTTKNAHLFWIFIFLHYLCTIKHRGIEQLVARQAHNLKVVFEDELHRSLPVGASSLNIET